ncbi:hypothetical protein JXB11_02455 [Candidatus Woesearchaeota archaeon]|nr:hypothetical protein [Candidatus Woesearchaeota archaeon]
MQQVFKEVKLFRPTERSDYSVVTVRCADCGVEFRQVVSKANSRAAKKEKFYCDMCAEQYV